MAKESWTRQFERLIANDMEIGRHVINELLAELKAHDWSPRDVFGVHLAMEEALINAILHGNRGDSNKYVDIRCRISPHTVHIEIRDEGTGFDPAALPDPTDPQRLNSPGGRGVMLMREFMSTVEFSDAGTAVIMEKRRARVPRR